MSFLKRIKDLGESVSHRANLRKEKVATDLAILISKAGLRRKDVASKLNISEAALSSRLKGNANLSLDTIGSICDVASVEFDVVFRKRGTPRSLSYWEKVEPSRESTVVIHDMSYLLDRTQIAIPQRRGYEFEIPSMATLVAANDNRVVKTKYEQEPIAA